MWCAPAFCESGPVRIWARSPIAYSNEEMERASMFKNKCKNIRIYKSMKEYTDAESIDWSYKKAMINQCKS
jgi:hypothetical protein